MNKTIVIVLAVFTCICAISCVICLTNISGGAKVEGKLIGRWEFPERNTVMEFYQDHTGRMASLDNEENGALFRWSYDEDADVYPIYIEGKAYAYYGRINADGNFVYNGETATRK